jgi:hypothetical protein
MIDKVIFGRKNGRRRPIPRCPEEASGHARQFVTIKELLTAAALGPL